MQTFRYKTDRRDVAIILHVHCLNPFRFVADMLSRDPNQRLWNSGISFPLERLHQLILTNTWTDTQSEELWTTAFPNHPYQLWPSSPISSEKSQINLQAATSSSEFSLDLVAAALRQRDFATRIVTECFGLDNPDELTRAILRYHKFLLLMKYKHAISKKTVPLVPTLEIDLAWHTHQLFPRNYREWCLEHVGRAINHDDSYNPGKINTGLRATSLAWLEAYGESYTVKDLRKDYFTPGRKALGMIFPPYGLFMLSRGRKLELAQIGKILGGWFG